MWAGVALIVLNGCAVAEGVWNRCDGPGFRFRDMAAKCRALGFSEPVRVW